MEGLGDEDLENEAKVYLLAFFTDYVKHNFFHRLTKPKNFLQTSFEFIEPNYDIVLRLLSRDKDFLISYKNNEYLSILDSFDIDQDDRIKMKSTAIGLLKF